MSYAQLSFAVLHYFTNVVLHPLEESLQNSDSNITKSFLAQALSMNRQKGFSITAKLPSQLSSAQGQGEWSRLVITAMYQIFKVSLSSGVWVRISFC